MRPSCWPQNVLWCKEWSLLCLLRAVNRFALIRNLSSDKVPAGVSRLFNADAWDRFAHK